MLPIVLFWSTLITLKVSSSGSVSLLSRSLTLILKELSSWVVKLSLAAVGALLGISISSTVRTRSPELTTSSKSLLAVSKLSASSKKLGSTFKLFPSIRVNEPASKPDRSLNSMLPLL